MSPLSQQNDTVGDVYVLSRYVNDRPVKPVPTTNAERPDTDFFYEEGYYNEFPNRKRRYEKRRSDERRKINNVQDWAVRAIDAIDEGKPMPPTTRLALAEVLLMVVDAGFNGITRPEICRRPDLDGGKVSGVMTDLHAGKIIFPLEGVRR
jgi:hypothetical protein